MGKITYKVISNQNQNYPYVSDFKLESPFQIIKIKITLSID